MTTPSEIPKLILISGLPGTGKTCLAQGLASHFGFPLFTKDRLQSRLRSQRLAKRNSVDGYLLILDLAEQQLELGISAILDGVFPMKGFRQRVKGMAGQHQAIFRPIYCHCSEIALWKERLESREQNVPNWTPVDWEEVERIQHDFLLWDKSAALFLDAVDPFEENLSKAIAWINFR